MRARSLPVLTQERTILGPRKFLMNGGITEIKQQQNTSQIFYALSAFVLESRRKDGKSYPPNTLRNILAALFRALKDTFGAGNLVSFMDNKQREKDYPRLHHAMDRHFRYLREQGIGVEKKQAAIITPVAEKTMWEKGVLGTYMPKVLLLTVFFYNGKNFCLRGQQEHATLNVAQIVRETDPDRYIYYEFGSKNHPGGVNDATYGKTVTIVDTGGPHSHVALLDLYFSKRPKMDDPQAPFYLTPYPFTPLNGQWYYAERYGVKHLRDLVKNMTKDAGLDGNYTNHSLRATGATTLFDAGVSEALIQKRTGHKSVDALRTYERVTMDQTREVSSILSSSLQHQELWSETSLCHSSFDTPVNTPLTSTPMTFNMSIEEVEEFCNDF